MVCWTVIVTTDCEYYTLMVSTLFKVGDGRYSGTERCPNDYTPHLAAQPGPGPLVPNCFSASVPGSSVPKCLCLLRPAPGIAMVQQCLSSRARRHTRLTAGCKSLPGPARVTETLYMDQNMVEVTTKFRGSVHNIRRRIYDEDYKWMDIETQ